MPPEVRSLRAVASAMSLTGQDDHVPGSFHTRYHRAAGTDTSATHGENCGSGQNTVLIHSASAEATQAGFLISIGMAAMVLIIGLMTVHGLSGRERN